MYKLSIIVPCYNESRTITEIIRRVLEAPLPGWEKEVIIVDDGSTDGTRDILQSIGPPITVIFQERNGGKGTAVRTGLDRAQGDYILVQDADLEYDPNEIQHLLAVIDTGKAEVVYGSRNLRPQEREGSLVLHAGVWFLTKMVNILYRLKLTDICTCYKLFPRAAADAVVPGGFESDILLGPALARRGYRFAEVPITYKPRSFAEGKKIRYRDGFRAIIAIIFDWLRNAYYAKES
jgi:glycosyltransferase involved in cell wall biosynthesis